MLEGKVALVTGASRGIGRAIAEELASQGAYVIINYSGNEQAASEVLNTITKMGKRASLYRCNVGSYEEVKEMIDTIVKEHKTIDIIVNNAGITRDNLLLKMSEQEFDDVITTNLKGAFNTIKHASRYMLKQRSGKIINISSVSGIIGNAGQTNYSAAKAGIIGMTKAVAKELASRNITVNAVAPGFIQTDMTEALPEAMKEKVSDSIPLKKMGQPEDIAKMVSFLASSQGDYVTGQVFKVDGGIAI
ncbi:MAG TPA: beta-ketoacyl-ACP reductase [Lachnospiraceae bacterium]|uniref:3-oxoacyl-[acyl-carrier-protein] reductase n=1 Tax=Anaerosporobacter sp. TaxID=1872529 RepID=UPI000EC6E058|nr:3-oxoacyl-[acyl-carrier-protein] reductase [Anaerosporobacter sp.]MBS5934233.1 3-oxoacyl-[acyl-carrier-protein] reductase [Clostridiales bacterium]HAB61250.1 beta-ketoacyl-ACP reductase [Lachnospiraceae bacterium]